MIMNVFLFGGNSVRLAEPRCGCLCSCAGHSSEYASGYFDGTGAGAWMRIPPVD